MSRRLTCGHKEQKQAVNVASASVQESCHCMHCNELLITLSVWAINAELATLARNCLCVCVLSFQFTYGAIICVCVCVCDLRIQASIEQMIGEMSC